MIYIPIFVNIVLLLLFDYRCLSFSLISVLFCLNRFWVLWMRYTAVGRASYDGFFCQLRSEWRKNLQKIHFKPPNQARRPTFASKKQNR